MSTHLTIENENRPNPRTATPEKLLSLVIVAEDMIFVSPELSSGRDLVYPNVCAACAVRRPPSMFFCPQHISGTV